MTTTIVVTMLAEQGQNDSYDDVVVVAEIGDHDAIVMMSMNGGM